MTPDSNLWLGTENSLLRVLQARQYAMQHPEKAADKTLMSAWDYHDDDADDDDEMSFDSHLIEMHGNVALLKISGPLVAEDSWWNRLFGLTSYPEIARAAMELGESDEVENVIANFDTNGGDVAGLEAASEALEWLAERKPLYTHTSGGMMSAGMWLGVNGKEITATRMSEVGSVGVLIVHRSIYKALKDQGVEYTVIRAGKYKALGHPSEELSEDAKAILQGKADELYSLFLEHVSSRRPALSVATKEAWAEGKTFFGDQALQLGLIDGVKTLSNRVEALDSSQEVDKRLQGSNNATEITLEESDMPQGKTVILQSDKDKAALESGAALKDLNVVEDEAQAAAAADAAASGSETDSTDDTDNAAAAAAEASETAGEEQAPAGSLDAYLKDQNADLLKQVTELTAKVTSLESQVANFETDAKGLREIAEASLHNMQVALNSEPIDLTDLPTSTVVAQHAKVRASFEARFRIGQQTAAAPVEDQAESGDAAATVLGIVPK